METIALSIIFVVSIFNSIMLIVIASALSKLIEGKEAEIYDDPVPNPKKASEHMIDLPVVGPPTYDSAVFDGKAEPYTDGMDRRLTPTRNWDGISQ